VTCNVKSRDILVSRWFFTVLDLFLRVIVLLVSSVLVITVLINNNSFTLELGIN